jgi:hypothetical protein
VSFRAYLDDLQKVLDNRYLLSFSAKPSTKAGLQYVRLSTVCDIHTFEVFAEVHVCSATRES